MSRREPKRRTARRFFFWFLLAFIVLGCATLYLLLRPPAPVLGPEPPLVRELRAAAKLPPASPTVIVSTGLGQFAQSDHVSPPNAYSFLEEAVASLPAWTDERYDRTNPRDHAFLSQKSIPAVEDMREALRVGQFHYPEVRLNMYARTGPFWQIPGLLRERALVLSMDFQDHAGAMRCTLDAVELQLLLSMDGGCAEQEWVAHRLREAVWVLRTVAVRAASRELLEEARKRYTTLTERYMPDPRRPIDFTARALGSTPRSHFADTSKPTTAYYFFNYVGLGTAYRAAKGAPNRRSAAQFMREHRPAFVEAAALSYPDYREWYAENHAGICGPGHRNGFEPYAVALGIKRAQTRIAALRHAMHIILALEQYSLDHNRYPEVLKDLCPEYLTPIPLDPFIEAPFHYRPVWDTYVLAFAGEKPESSFGPCTGPNTLYSPGVFPAEPKPAAISQWNLHGVFIRENDPAADSGMRSPMAALPPPRKTLTADPLSGAVDLASGSPVNGDTAAYASCELQSQRPCGAQFILNGTGLLSFWLDDQLLLRSRLFGKRHSWQVVPVDLSEGKHTLLIKLQPERRAEFTVILTDRQGNPAP